MTEPFAPPQGRYLDALLTEMDRWIMPELGSARAQALYQSGRRVLATLGMRANSLPALDELGLGIIPGENDSADAITKEGRRIDALILAQDRRIATVGSPEARKALSVEDVETAVRAAGESSARVKSMRLVIGGRSKETILIELEGANVLPARLVMRRDLQVGSLGTSVVDEFALLEVLHGQGVSVPRPYHLSRTGDGLGLPYLLLEAMPGEATGQLLTAPDSREKVLGAARALATVHAVPAPIVAPVLRPAGVHAERLSDQIERFRDTWETKRRVSSPTVNASFRWLSATVDATAHGACLVHADYSFHNILFDGDRVSAILDWELARLGHPAEDLGYIKFAAQRVVPWSDFIHAYADAGGQQASSQEVHFYALLGKTWLLVTLLKARDLFETGATDDILKADAVTYWLPRVIQSLSVEMREIMSEESLPKI